jgi:outer membrane protein assembly factor BamB
MGSAASSTPRRSPLAAADGVIVSLSGYMGPGLALRGGGQGDVTATHRLWRHEHAPQRIGSGVIAGEHLYLVNEPGVAECLELKTGATVWKERLGQTTWSSLVLAGDRIYAPDQEGDCAVFRAAPRFEFLARSSLGELTRASFAVSRGEVFIRTDKHLWCFSAARSK